MLTNNGTSQFIHGERLAFVLLQIITSLPSIYIENTSQFYIPLVNYILGLHNGDTSLYDVKLYKEDDGLNFCDENYNWEVINGSLEVFLLPLRIHF